MKKLIIVLMMVAMASFLFVGCLGDGVTPPVDEDEDEDVVVTLAAISGVTAPVTDATPVTAITATAQYTGVVTWSPVATTFAAATAYTATITLTAKTGYTLTGVAANFFTVAGATDTNPIDSGVVTAVFPATAPAAVVPATNTPTITKITDIDITKTTTQYVNKTEAADGVTVSGSAATLAEVSVLINDVAIAATANVTATGTWSLIIAKAELGSDGVKTVKAVASEAGLTDATSISYKFTLDTVAPKISAVKATAEKAAAAGTAKVSTGGTALTVTGATLGTITPAKIVTGTWTIDILGITGVAANVKITGPSFENTYSQVAGGQVFAVGAPIPGVGFTLTTPITVGQKSIIVCTATVAQIAGRFTLKYDGDVSSTGEALATYAVTDAGTAVAGLTLDSYKESNDTRYWTSTAAGDPTEGDTLLFTVSLVTDAAGNPMPVTTATCVVTAANKTTLKP